MIGVLTALWMRPAVSRAVLRYYAQFEAVRVAVRSQEDPEPCKKVKGWIYAEAPNRPLSNKWNAGLNIMKRHAVDAVMIVGSDDYVSRPYIDRAMEEIATGADLVHFDTLHALDADTGRLVRLQPRRMGAGRVISRRLLVRAEWRLWPSGLNRLLDGGMDRRLREVRGRGDRSRHFKSVRLRAGSVPGAVILDVKSTRADGSSANLWSFEDMRRWKAQPVTDTEEVLKHFPDIRHGKEEE